jgi:hypothetical protein
MLLDPVRHPLAEAGHPQLLALGRRHRHRLPVVTAHLAASHRDPLHGPQVQALRQILVQNYHRDSAGRLRWRGDAPCNRLARKKHDSLGHPKISFSVSLSSLQLAPDRVAIFADNRQFAAGSAVRAPGCRLRTNGGSWLSSSPGNLH